MLELETSEEKGFGEHEDWKVAAESNLLFEELGHWSSEAGNATGKQSILWLLDSSTIASPLAGPNPSCEDISGTEKELVEEVGSIEALAIDDDIEDIAEEKGEVPGTEGETSEKSDIFSLGISWQSSEDDGSDSGDGGGVGDDGLFMVKTSGHLLSRTVCWGCPLPKLPTYYSPEILKIK